MQAMPGHSFKAEKSSFLFYKQFPQVLQQITLKMETVYETEISVFSKLRINDWMINKL